jgi:hypothetical protein
LVHILAVELIQNLQRTLEDKRTHTDVSEGEQGMECVHIANSTYNMSLS